MEAEGLACLLYCNDRVLADRLERALAGVAVRRVNSREALVAPSLNLCGTVYGTAACSEGEAAWLGSVLGPLSPPCVVVANLSVDGLHRLYPLRSRRLRVLWADEIEHRLVDVLRKFSSVGRGPMCGLGLTLLSRHSFRPSLREVIGRVCGLRRGVAGTRFLPENSVARLAFGVNVPPSTLRQHWREEVPLRCSLKEFLSWAVLLCALRARANVGWSAVADQMGLRRRTLERKFIGMAGCTLAAAAENPERVLGRVNEWVQAVWDPAAAIGSWNDDALPGAGPDPSA